MKFKLGTLGAIAVAATMAVAAVPAQAADLGAAVLKVRQDAMKAQGGDMKAINDALEAATFDPAAAQAAAASLEDHVQNLEYLFVPGTGIDDGVGETAAKMEIWTDWTKFLEVAANMEMEAAKFLEAAAGGDKAAIGAALGEMGKNGCGGCHSLFRQKKAE